MLNQDLTNRLVRISKEGKFIGSGIIINANGLMLSCYHNFFYKEGGERQPIDFLSLRDNGSWRPICYQDNVKLVLSDDKQERKELKFNDIFLVRITASINPQLYQLPLSRKVEPGDTVSIIVWDNTNQDQVLTRIGLITKVEYQTSNNPNRFHTDIDGYPGYSGGAVFKDGMLVGVINLIQSERANHIIASFIPTNISKLIKDELAIDINTQTSKLNNVPALPSHYLPRSEDIHLLKEFLLKKNTKTIGITGATYKLGLQGMGGIGKSILAISIATDEDIGKYFFNGIYWITVGQNPELKQLQEQLAEALGDSPRVFDTISKGRSCLSKLLQGKKCLIILDDVWQVKHLDPFNIGLSETQLLITTRDSNILTCLGAIEHKLEILSPEQALIFLSKWVGIDINSLPLEAFDIVEECGKLPLALAMIGSMLRGKPNRWQNILEKLRNSDLEKISQQFPDYPYPNLFRAIQVSVEALETNIKYRYLDFAVFPEDIPIPEITLKTFWKIDNHDDFECEDILYRLVEMALLQRDNNRCVTLHDLQFDYVKKQTINITELHKKLLAGYKLLCKQQWYSGPNDGYYFEHLAYHLYQAKEYKELKTLLTSYKWLHNKLNNTNISALILDYNFLSDPELDIIKEALRLSEYALSIDKTQLKSQLWGRLSDQRSPTIKALLSAFFYDKNSLWLRPLVSGLSKPVGLLLFNLTQHEGVVNCVAITSDGKKAISGSDDRSIRLWDLEHGREILVLESHSESVTSVAITSDGKKAISGSDDKTIRLWDLERRKQIGVLDGHLYGIISVLMTSDGKRAISNSYDKSVKVWNLEDGQEKFYFEFSLYVDEHKFFITAMALTHDETQFIIASELGEILLCDIENGNEKKLFLENLDVFLKIEEYSTITSLATSYDDKKIIVGSSSGHIGVWDIETGKMYSSFNGHTDWVTGIIAIDQNNRIASSSRDQNIKVWDLISGKESLSLDGHFNWVTTIAVTQEPKILLSGSKDKIIKVWNLESRKRHSSNNHDSEVDNVALTDNGKLALSCSQDGTMLLWDISNKKPLKYLEGHNKSVFSVFSLGYKSAISASEDGLIKLWDLEKATKLHSFHFFDFSDISQVETLDSHNILISNSADGILKLWDLHSGKQLLISTEDKIKEKISTFALIPGTTQILCAFSKGRLGVHYFGIFDLVTRKQLKIIKNPYDGVEYVDITPDGKKALFVTDNDHIFLIVWSLELQKELSRIPLKNYPQIVNFYILDTERILLPTSFNTIELWNIVECRLVLTLDGHEDEITSMSLLKKDRLLISASLDCTIKVWDLNNGETIVSFYTDSPILSCDAIKSDKLIIIAGDRSGKVHILQLET